MPRNRIYLGPFLIVILIIIPYFIGGNSTILGTLIFSGLGWLLTQLLRMVLPNWFKNSSPTASFLLIALIMVLIFIALFILSFSLFGSRSF